MDTNAFHAAVERIGSAIAFNTDRAGEGFAWEGVKRTSYPGSDVRSGVRLGLYEACGGLCAYCGGTLEHVWEDWHLGHLVSAHGRKGHGYVMGGDHVNVFPQHAACNYDAEYRDGFIIPVTSLARPDVIPMEAPTRAQCFQGLNARAEAAMFDAVALGVRDAAGVHIPKGERIA